MRLPGDSAVPSHGVPSVSFGAPIEDQMSIAASVDGQSSSEDEDSAKLHPSGVRGRRRIRPRVDGRAFPGRSEIGAGGVHTS